MRKAQDFQKALQRQVPVKMQAEAVRVFRANFKAQGFVDNGVRPWPPRKKEPRMARKKPSPKILIRSGLLLNSIRPAGQATWNRIAVQAGGPHVPYARIHNEGGNIRGTFNVRKHTRRTRRGKPVSVRAHARTVDASIPPRPYMGNSLPLRMSMRKIILETMVKTLGK